MPSARWDCPQSSRGSLEQGAGYSEGCSAGTIRRNRAPATTHSAGKNQLLALVCDWPRPCSCRRRRGSSVMWPLVQMWTRAWNLSVSLSIYLCHLARIYYWNTWIYVITQTLFSTTKDFRTSPLQPARPGFDSTRYRNFFFIRSNRKLHQSTQIEKYQSFQFFFFLISATFSRLFHPIHHFMGFGNPVDATGSRHPPWNPLHNPIQLTLLMWWYHRRRLHGICPFFLPFFLEDIWLFQRYYGTLVITSAGKTRNRSAG